MCRVALLGVLAASVLFAGCATSELARDAGLDATVEIDAPSDLGAAPDLPPIDADALRTGYCEPMAALLCGWSESCGCAAQIASGAIDRARCEAAWTAQCIAEAAAVWVGPARFDAARAGACIELIRTRNASCHGLDMRFVNGLCEPFIIGPAAIGEPCAAAICADGTGYCADGICRPRLGAPERCYGSEACRTGLVCVRGLCVPLTPEGVRGCIGDEDCEPSLVCVDGLCARPGIPGARCFEDDDCAFLSTCVSGACVARASACGGREACGGHAGCGGAWTCEPRALEGEPCGWANWTRDCAPDLYCGEGFRCARRRLAGEACGSSGLCVAGLACNGPAYADGICVAPPGLGSPCFSGEFGPVECAPGLACVVGTCAEMPTDGEQCSDDRRCAPGLTCGLGSDGYARCGAPRAEGERCLPGACAAPLVCTGIDAVCTPPRPPGASCPTQSECGGACVRSPSTLLECADTGGRGQPCYGHENCAPDLHCTIANPVCIAFGCFPF